MDERIWLSWFPVALVAGIASSYVSAPRGRVLTVLFAAIWVAIAALLTHGQALLEVTVCATLLFGVVSIGWIGWWASVPRSTNKLQDDAWQPPQAAETETTWKTAAELLARFQEAHPSWIGKTDPWPDFGEFVRSMIQELCKGRFVRPYRLSAANSQLVPLRSSHPDEEEFPSARSGLLGYVVTTGRSYYDGDPNQGALVLELAAGTDDSCTWCFPVRSGRATIGVICVQQLDDETRHNRHLLRAVEGLVGACWLVVAEGCRSRLVGDIDPVSGVLSHQAFMDAARQALDESYQNDEPVAMVNICVEGLRRLHDENRWELAAELLNEISAALTRRMRRDDEIGVLDGTRFLVLFRRVDSELATLIIRQMMDRLVSICADVNRWGAQLQVRCGVAGSGVSKPGLRELVERACENAKSARQRKVLTVTDLTTANEAARS